MRNVIFQIKKKLVVEKQISKTFESCQFHDRIIDVFECYIARIYKTSTGNYISCGKFQNSTPKINFEQWCDYVSILQYMQKIHSNINISKESQNLEISPRFS